MRTLAVLPDGKILVGGNFITVGGVSRSRIARLNADGSLDTDFTTPGANAMVHSLVVQTDGKILAAGEFTALAGVSRSRLGRLNTDGTIDADFLATTDWDVYTLALQADGKILVGGQFTILAGETCYRIGRLTLKDHWNTTSMEVRMITSMPLPNNLMEKLLWAVNSQAWVG